MIIIVKFKLIKFYNYNIKMLLITNKELNNKVSIFFKGFLRSKRQF